MKIQTVITIVVVMTGVGVGSYYAYNNITVIVNAPAPETPEQSTAIGPIPDFRERIAGYESMGVVEKRKALEAIFEDLEGDEKRSATVELVKLGREIIRERAKEPAGEDGYVPEGWGD